MLSVRCQFPDFEVTACVSRDPKKAFETITGDSYPGKWVIYVFWPNDFTPVCATELAAFGIMAEEFAERDAVVVGASVDSHFVHLAWCRSSDQPGDYVPFTLLSDMGRKLSTALGILDSAGVARRATFIVDPDHTIRHISVNDFSVGRNPKDTLRVLDALQTDGLCPAHWQRGDATITDETALVQEQGMLVGGRMRAARSVENGR